MTKKQELRDILEGILRTNDEELRSNLLACIASDAERFLEAIETPEKPVKHLSRAQRWKVLVDLWHVAKTSQEVLRVTPDYAEKHYGNTKQFENWTQAIGIIDKDSFARFVESKYPKQFNLNSLERHVYSLEKKFPSNNR
jgi:hypothetical protein